VKILFVYPNAEGYGRIPLGISIIITILLENNHTVELFDTTFIMINENTDSIIREKAKLALPTDRSHLYDPQSADGIDEMLKEKVKKFSPDLIAMNIVEDNYQYADHLLQVIKSLDRTLPVIVGGSTPTVVPEVVIENPHIDYLVQGEGEEAMKEFCDLLERGKSLESVKNLWYKKNGEVKTNPIRPFVNMDTLPVQNLDIWDKRHFAKPYSGKLYKVGYFEMSRGCLNKCSYCINDACQMRLHEAGNFHREKAIKKVIGEIKIQKDKYNFEMIFFCDDNFLLMSRARMDEFADSWKSEITLPYWMNTTVETINRENLTKLKETGCAGIGIGIESGSEWLRRNVLKRKTRNEQIKKAFDLIHEFGIRTTANNMIGFPGEYEEDIFETIKLNREIKPKSCDLNFVAPYIGTTIHAISKRLGYLDMWDKPGFRGMVKNISTRSGLLINNPHLNRERIMGIFYEFMDYVEGRLPIPDEYKKPAPGSKKSALPRGEMGKEVMEAFMTNMMIRHGGDGEKGLEPIKK
jgi:radical SAM superfamily enzyme YgiQ (UPF0313 family)